MSISKKSFMAEMRNLLTFMDASDRDRALARYDDLFALVGPDREDELIAAFGSAVRQVLATEKEYSEAKKTGISPFYKPLSLPEGFELRRPVVSWDAAENSSAEPGEDDSFVRAAANVLEDEKPEDTTWEAISSMDEDFPMESLISADEAPLQSTEIYFPEVVFGMPEGEPEEAQDTAGSEKEPTEALFSELAPASEDASGPETAAEDSAAEPEKIVLPSPEKTAEAPEPASVFLAAMSAADAEVPKEAQPEKAPDELIAALPKESGPKRPPESSRPKAAAVKKNSPGAGQVMAAILVTFPFIILWIVSFAFFISLGLAVMAVGFALCVAGVYFTGYVTGGVLSFMPDLLLIAGIALVCFALALLFIWMGLWIAVGGFASVLRWTSGVYRKILRKKAPKKGGTQ